MLKVWFIVLQCSLYYFFLFFLIFFRNLFYLLSRRDEFYLDLVLFHPPLAWNFEVDYLVSIDCDWDLRQLVSRIIEITYCLCSRQNTSFTIIYIFRQSLIGFVFILVHVFFYVGYLQFFNISIVWMQEHDLVDVKQILCGLGQISGLE